MPLELQAAISGILAFGVHLPEKERAFSNHVNRQLLNQSYQWMLILGLPQVKIAITLR